MTEPTTGYLITKIDEARQNQAHENHSEGKRYYTNFRALEGHLFAEEHVYTDAGLAIAEWLSGLEGVGRDDERGITIFTTHGPRHVTDVIKSLDKLAKNIDNNTRDGFDELDIDEAYILLCAAHFHDIGNIGGRIGHPERIRDKIAGNKDRIAGTFLAQQIFDVASSHGGEDEEFGKDKIRRLKRGRKQSQDYSCWPRCCG